MTKKLPTLTSENSMQQFTWWLTPAAYASREAIHSKAVAFVTSLSSRQAARGLLRSNSDVSFTSAMVPRKHPRNNKDVIGSAA